MLGHRGVEINDERKRRFLITQTISTGHPGSKKRAKHGKPGSRAARRYNNLGLLLMEKGIMPWFGRGGEDIGRLAGLR